MVSESFRYDAAWMEAEWNQGLLPRRTQESVILSIRCHVVRNNAEILCFGDGWGGDAKRCV